MKKLLVSGGSGLLGANCLLLLKDRWQATGLYRRHPVRLPGVVMRGVDLLDRGAVRRVVEEVRPEVFIHCAAMTDVDYCEAHPDEAFRVNGEVVDELASLAREYDFRLVAISTDAVYERESGVSAETDPTLPVNVYGRSKLAGEQAALAGAGESLVLRTCIYGWNARSKLSFGEAVLKALLGGQDITLFRDVRFSPILVNDLVVVMEGLIAQGASGLYNVGSRAPLTKLAFGELLAGFAGLSGKGIRSIAVAEKNLAAARPRNPAMDVAKVEAALGRPMPTAAEGLRRFLGLFDSGYVGWLKDEVGKFTTLREVWQP